MSVASGLLGFLNLLQFLIECVPTLLLVLESQLYIVEFFDALTLGRKELINEFLKRYLTIMINIDLGE